MPTTNVVTSSSTPPWLSAEYEHLMGRAREQSETGYQTYNNPRLAEFNQDQETAFQMGRDNLGVAQGLQDEGLATMRAAGQAPTQAGIQQYMNPYSNLVQQNTLEEMNRQNQIDNTRVQAGAVNAGAFGGSRHGIVEAEMARNQSQQKQRYIDQSNQANYQQGLNQFNNQQQVQMGLGGAIAGQGSVRQGMNAQDVSSLAGIGSVNQGYDQQNLNMAYDDFTRQQNHPRQNISWYNNLLQGHGQDGSSTKTTTKPDPSSISQIGGIVSGIGSYLGNNPGIVSGVSDWVGGLFSSGGGGMDTMSAFSDTLSDPNDWI